MFLRLNRLGFLLVIEVNRVRGDYVFVMLHDIPLYHFLFNIFVLLFENLPLMFGTSLSDLMRPLHSLVDHHDLAHAN